MATLRQWNENGHAIVHAGFAVDFSSRPTTPTITDLATVYGKGQ